MVVTGAKSEDASCFASRKYACIVQKFGFDAKSSDFKIQNKLKLITTNSAYIHTLQYIYIDSQYMLI
ncbi:uncharacterized protein LACBIDRAFT_314470 [Laccaria bicolor S238N-H82]|uniref:Predicted protein n=1 Tax=Laccaria bicolor (strain S238N-H82 / ATCC MYA-4686) TaxID=486041 RepID=B0DYM2_LACBS|nr:uncharacterized protein LACBIDRAFT_314470 [Laccaria bicolor S238N-H82]EDR00270.1 predicted protein [Laccaria bicolor S238N-H82]|eukprot:XP_001889022.1 predicted protein [Laccaria bicolor S238N-H82]